MITIYYHYLFLIYFFQALVCSARSLMRSLACRCKLDTRSTRSLTTSSSIITRTPIISTLSGYRCWVCVDARISFRVIILLLAYSFKSTLTNKHPSTDRKFQKCIKPWFLLGSYFFPFHITFLSFFSVLTDFFLIYC